MNTKNHTPSIKSLLLAAFVAAWACSVTSLQAADAFLFRVNKHKAESVEKDGKGPVERTTDTYFYKVGIRSMSPLNDTETTLQYIVYTKQPNGEITPALFNSREVKLQLSKEAIFETDPFHTRTVEIDRKRNKFDRTAQSEVEGYALRIINQEGTTLGEQLSSVARKIEVDWSVFDPEEEKPGKGLGKDKVPGAAKVPGKASAPKIAPNKARLRKLKK